MLAQHILSCVYNPVLCIASRVQLLLSILWICRMNWEFNACRLCVVLRTANYGIDVMPDITSEARSVRPTIDTYVISDDLPHSKNSSKPTRDRGRSVGRHRSVHTEQVQTQKQYSATSRIFGRPASTIICKPLPTDHNHRMGDFYWCRHSHTGRPTARRTEHTSATAPADGHCQTQSAL